MNLEKKIIALEKRIAKLEAHQHPIPKKPKPKPHQKEDYVLRRERLEEAPIFTDAQLWSHNILHKQDELPPHNHKESTMRQFREFTRRGVEKKDKADNKKIEAERLALIKEATENLAFKKALKYNIPQKVKVTLHKLTKQRPSLPYAWVTWEPPKKCQFQIMGYYIEENGSCWPLKAPRGPYKRLLRDFKKGSRVRIGVVYKRSKGRDDTAWSDFKHRR